MKKQNTVKYEVIKNKKRRLFKVLLIIAIISFIIGILYVAIISKSDKELIRASFSSYFNNINDNTYNSYNILISNILSNILLTVIIWIFGISIIGIPVSISYLIYKSFVLGFTISSLIYTYKLKIIPITIIYIIPLIINLLTIFILTFYAINLSHKLFLFLFKKKDLNITRTVKIYSRFLLIMLIILFVSSIFSSYIVPILIKSFTKSMF